MNEYEQKLVITEIIGWKWQRKQTSHGYWTRTLLPPCQIGEYTPIWDGIIPCDGVDVSYLDYFKPHTEPADALEVKDYMEEVRGFLCEINYHTGAREPWCVTFNNFHVRVASVGVTLHEAIVRAVLKDELIEHVREVRST